VPWIKKRKKTFFYIYDADVDDTGIHIDDVSDASQHADAAGVDRGSAAGRCLSWRCFADADTHAVEIYRENEPTCLLTVYICFVVRGYSIGKSSLCYRCFHL